MARIAGASVNVKFAANWVRQIAGRADPKMRVVAELVKRYQVEHIPIGDDVSHGREPGYARDRIAVRVTVGANGFKVFEVGSDATTPEGFPYPVVLDVGSRPHEIESHGDYPLRTADGDVLGKKVQHPGTQATNWCRGSLSVVPGAF